MNGLDLFSGIGGLTVALAPWARPIAYCENDRFAQGVLLSRQRDGLLPVAPIWDDVRTLSGQDLPRVDLVYGGFPCQDISVAGRRAGLDGERSGLFWEVVRIVEETKPTFVFLENVWPGMSRHVEAVTDAFAQLGFQGRDGNLAAADVGANHRRERWFGLFAHPERLKLWLESGRSGREGWTETAFVGVASKAGEVAADASRFGLNALGPTADGRTEGGSFGNTNGQGLALGEGVGSNNGAELAPTFRAHWWTSEPAVGRVVDGFADKLARARHVCELHALGNGVVPLQAREAFSRLIGGLL